MAGIIRKDQLPAARSFSFADLERQGREILSRARAEAEKTLRVAEETARRVAEERGRAAHAAAYERGLTEGRAAGMEQIRTEARAAAFQEARDAVAALVRALTDLVTEFEQSKRRLLSAAESGLIELALAIARRVCKREAGSSSAAALANARAVLEMVPHVADAELHMNPAETGALAELAPAWLAAVGSCRHVRVVADDSVGPGGCRLIMAEGEIDADLETQLDRTAAALCGHPES